MANIEAFENYSQQYEDWFERNEFIYKSELKAVKHFIPEGKKGLEVGIGSGRFAKPLGIEIGVEPSLEMRKLAEHRGLEVYDATGESLSFTDNSFDFVLMVTTICFLDDVQKTFKEVRKVLKEEGSFIIGFVDKNTSLGKIYEEKKKDNVFYKKAKFYSAEKVLSLLKEYNFKNIEVVQTLSGKLPEIDKVQDFKEGHGEGGFVVIKGKKIQE